MNSAAFLTAAIVAFTLGLVFLQSNPNASILIQSLAICVVASMNTALIFARRLYHCAVLEESELQLRYKGETTSSTSSHTTHGSSSENHNKTRSTHNYSLGVYHTNHTATSPRSKNTSSGRQTRSVSSQEA